MHPIAEGMYARHGLPLPGVVPKTARRACLGGGGASAQALVFAAAPLRLRSLEVHMGRSDMASEASPLANAPGNCAPGNQRRGDITQCLKVFECLIA